MLIEGKAGFGAESGPDDAGAKSVDVCVPEAGAVPKSGFAVLSALVVVAVDSAGLLALIFPNNPPPVAVEDGALTGVCCVDGLRRLFPVDCPAPPKSGGVDVEGAVEEGWDPDEVVAVPKRPPGFCCPKRDCPWAGVFPCGGGPAGVVEGWAPKSEPVPDDAGVAAAAPKRPLPAGLLAPPNNPPGAVEPDAGVSVGLLGVCDPVPNRDGDCVPEVAPAAEFPKLNVGAPLPLPEPAPNREELWPGPEVAPKDGEEVPLAPTFPKRPPPLDPVFDVAPADPNIPPLGAPDEAGGLKLNRLDMAETERHEYRDRAALREIQTEC